jgi:hypothetical protein
MSLLDLLLRPFRTLRFRVTASAQEKEIFFGGLYASAGLATSSLLDRSEKTAAASNHDETAH